MSISAERKPIRATSLLFRADKLVVALDDGREIAVPVNWFRRLASATPEQRANYRFIAGGLGIHFPDIDEDISVEALLR